MAIVSPFACCFNACFCVAEAAPLQLKCYTPGYVQAAIDNLRTNDLYIKKLQLTRQEKKTADEPGPEPSTSGHDTRGASKEPEEVENPVKKAMGFKDFIRGKAPPAYQSAAALRGPAREFSLSNTQELTRLTAYLYLNGKYDLYSTPKDGACMFSAVRWGCDIPVEYVTPLFRRDLVVFLAENADYFYHELEQTILGTYGGLRLTREEYLQKTKAGTITPSEEFEYNHPGPFSYQEYLQYLLLDTTWGDEALIVTMSKRWQLAITVVHGEDLRESRVRHDRPLEDADLVLVFCGHNHYVGASKYIFFLCRWVRVRFVRLWHFSCGYRRQPCGYGPVQCGSGGSLCCMLGSLGSFME